jgi:exodeoxyribonuclease VII large subunit
LSLLHDSTSLPEFTVSELAFALKKTLEDSYGYVRIRGEISGLKRHTSGHMYFSLKDSEAVISGVSWRGMVPQLGIVPEEGMEVIASGRITTYPGRSQYQVVVERMEIAGVGALLKLLEDRKKKLFEEGLFDPDKKQPLPFLPDLIGIITSPTGAVIQDILHRLSDRFPRHVMLWPVLVQGDGASEQVAKAIDGFNSLSEKFRPDVLIVARGGGSLEDLWAFNEECVVRAVYESRIPIISAVGHETDTTLIDYVADRRAPTPTAAAEIAVPVKTELLSRISESHSRLNRSLNRNLMEMHNHVDHLGRRLGDPLQIIEFKQQRRDDCGERLQTSFKNRIAQLRTTLLETASQLVKPHRLIDEKKYSLDLYFQRLAINYSTILKEKTHQLHTLEQLLESSSYERILKRGFALVSDWKDQTLSSAQKLKPGLPIRLTFHDGKKEAVVTGAQKKPSSKKRTNPSVEISQGTLL